MATSNVKPEVLTIEKARSIAESWTESGTTRFQLLPASPEDERKLIFQCGDLSFFIVCPSKEEDNWHLWTENDAALAALSDIIDQLTGCRRKSLQELLQSVQKALNEAVDGSDNGDDDDEDDDDDNYYAEEDDDALMDDTVPTMPTAKIEENSSMELDRFSGEGSPIAIQRLQKDLRNMQKSNGQFGVIGNPRDNNLFVWDVQLTGFEQNTRLGQDLMQYAKKFNKPAAILMEMIFPQDYPMAPPFVRVLLPRFKFLTGHVTIGGSICMEMLAKSGWRPTNDIESILVQVRSAIMSDKDARLDSKPDVEYTKQEAETAFIRMVKRYKWDQ